MRDDMNKNIINTTVSRLVIVYCITAFMVFLFGLTIYILFRNNNVVLFQYFQKPLFLSMLPFSVKANNIWMSMFLYNLPDGLWFLSGLLIIRAVWLTNIKWRAIYCGIFALIALSLEVLQISEGVPGTFDFLDITFMAFFAFAESLFFNLFIKRRVFI